MVDRGEPHFSCATRPGAPGLLDRLVYTPLDFLSEEATSKAGSRAQRCFMETLLMLTDSSPAHEARYPRPPPGGK